MTNDDDIEIASSKHRFWLNLTMAIIFIATILIWAATWYFEDKISADFGDKFGVITSLFSGLAFVGLIYALGLQIQEIKLQKLELRKNREEMRINNHELAAQNQAMKLQNFQAQFSDMMSIYFNSLELIQCHDCKNIEAINAANVHENFESTKSLAIQLDNICQFIDDSQLTNVQKSSFEKTVLGRLSPPEKNLVKLLSEDGDSFTKLDQKIQVN